MHQNARRARNNLSLPTPEKNMAATGRAAPKSKTHSRTTAGAQNHQSASTSWTAILYASRPDSAEAREALSRLCGAYWGPLRAYARRLGHTEEDAKDLTQGFFAELLEKNLFGAADRKKGKFRSFLLTAFNHFLSDEKRRTTAAKRGGGQSV